MNQGSGAESEEPALLAARQRLALALAADCAARLGGRSGGSGDSHGLSLLPHDVLEMVAQRLPQYANARVWLAANRRNAAGAGVGAGAGEEAEREPDMENQRVLAEPQVID